MLVDAAHRVIAGDRASYPGMPGWIAVGELYCGQRMLMHGSQNLGVPEGVGKLPLLPIAIKKSAHPSRKGGIALHRIEHQGSLPLARQHRRTPGYPAEALVTHHRTSKFIARHQPTNVSPREL